MDHLASIGMNGLYHSLTQGIPMSSETAHFLIFGNDIGDFPGRGVLEAIGEGISVEKDDVAILCHVCSVDKRDNCLILTHGRPESHDEAVRALKDEIRTFEAEGIGIQLIHSRKIDGFLILKGDVSADITDSDPIYEGKPVIEVIPTIQKLMTGASKKTAEALNRYLIWSHKRLSAHPINMDRAAGGLLPINALVTQRAGKKRGLTSFLNKWGLRVSQFLLARLLGIMQRIKHRYHKSPRYRKY